MKRKASDYQNTKNHISPHLFLLLMLFSALLSCEPFTGFGDGDDSCQLNPSLFDGQFNVSDVCDASWGSSNYVLTMTMIQDPNFIGCGWSIQNMFGKGITIGAAYIGSTSELSILAQGIGNNWSVNHGSLSKSDTEITINVFLENSSRDSTISCTITGTKI